MGGNQGVVGGEHKVRMNGLNQDLIEVDALEEFGPVLGAEGGEDREQGLRRLPDENHAAGLKQEVNPAPENSRDVDSLIAYHTHIMLIGCM